MNIIEFFVNTYEEDVGKLQKYVRDTTDVRGVHDDEENNLDESGRG